MARAHPSECRQKRGSPSNENVSDAGRGKRDEHHDIQKDCPPKRPIEMLVSVQPSSSNSRNSAEVPPLLHWSRRRESFHNASGFRPIGVNTPYARRMIIEAGYELRELIAPRLARNAASKQELWILKMDRDLRFSGSAPIVEQLGPSILPHIRTILDALHPDYGHYFAIAHWDNQPQYHQYGDSEPDDAVLGEAAESRGFEFIGHIVLDGESWHSSGPMYSFRDYGGDLPRALVVRGPHPFGCDCVACVDFEQKLAAARASAGEADSDGRSGDPGSRSQRISR